jgi:hypothetical protein
MNLAKSALLLAIAGSLCLLAHAQSPPVIVTAEPMLPPRDNYVGDATCVACHRDQSASYVHTAHHLTSQPANTTSVLGSFLSGSNQLAITEPADSAAEPSLIFKMEIKDGTPSETAITQWDSTQLSRTERMDIVTGSGTRGQTYLYWQGDALYELPVSYWSDGHRWINSPGYIDGTADFSRPVNPGCLECHATYIRPLSSNPLTNHYDRATFIPGISCESCHGPGAAHVALQKTHAPGTRQPTDQSILNPAHFTRDRQVDLCAQCHNGIHREAIAPAFSYLPGKPLSDYFKPLPSDPLEHPDVHGNQVGLLQRSRCYLSSPDMTCSTCHDVHSTERPAASYSQKCLTCHQWQSCGVSKQIGHKIVNNCIDCHMPVEPTNVIVSETADKLVRATMRNHWIKVYSAPTPTIPSTPVP